MGNAPVELRPQAVQDLSDIATYLAVVSTSDRTAARFLAAAESSFESLVEMPLLGVAREFADSGLEGIRMWLVESFEDYLIFYRPLEVGIEIIRVLHARRDINSLFGED